MLFFALLCVEVQEVLRHYLIQFVHLSDIVKHHIIKHPTREPGASIFIRSSYRVGEI